jgi:hypothetical protein
MRRVLLGLLAGAIAGIGLRLTWRPFMPARCAYSENLDCTFTMIPTLPWFLLGWMVVAGVVLHRTQRESPDVRDTIKIGSALWALLTVLAWLAEVLPTVEIVLPVVAYAVAGAVTGRVRPDERNET